MTDGGILSSIFHAADALIVLLDTEGRIKQFSRACEEATGFLAGEVEGKRIWDLSPEPDEVKAAKGVFRQIKGGTFPIRHESHWLTREGGRRLISWSSTATVNPGGVVETIVCIGTDVTGHREVLRELQQRSHGLGERVKELNCLYAISRLREDADLPVGKVLLEIVSLIPRAWQYPEIACARIAVGDEQYSSPSFRDTPWKQSSPVIVHGERIGSVVVGYLEERPELGEGPFLTEERHLIDAIAERIGRIIEHRRAAERVMEYQQRLRSLGSELALSEERERRRIAMDLHDQVGHVLAIAKLKLEQVAQSVPTGGVDEVIGLIDETISGIRTLTFELSPPVLHELGFGAALEWLAKQVQEKQRLRAQFVDDGLAKPLREDTKVMLFQAVRELLVNVVKHARASNVRVGLRRTNGMVRVDVEDDGVGFDPTELEARRGKDGGFGLFNVGERLRYLGGKIEVASAPGYGSRISLLAPLGEPKEGSGALQVDGQVPGATPRTGRTIRILLAEDHQITREGLRALLDKEPDVEVIAEARDGEDAVRLAAEHAPDVVIMDIAMPRLTGIEATRRIVAESPGVKVVALSMHADKQFVLEMLRAGASGYLLKDCARGDLARAIRTVDSNLTFLSSGVADTVVEEFARRQVADDGGGASVLTPREREVLSRLAEGRSTKEIATVIGVSVKTVETHRQHMMDKLELRSVAELTKFAIREGLTGLGK